MCHPLLVLREAGAVVVDHGGLRGEPARHAGRAVRGLYYMISYHNITLHYIKCIVHFVILCYVMLDHVRLCHIMLDYVRLCYGAMDRSTRRICSETEAAVPEAPLMSMLVPPASHLYIYIYICWSRLHQRYISKRI